MRDKRNFANLKNATEFAKKVNGKVNDLSKDPKARSKYSVTFQAKENKYSWSPEDGRDFGYSNEFWN